MTFKNNNHECDRCGKIYIPKDSEDNIILRLPTKSIPAANVKGVSKIDDEPIQQPTLIMLPIPGIDPKALQAQIKPEVPESVFLEFCPDCEISCIQWFNVRLWNHKVVEYK